MQQLDEIILELSCQECLEDVRDCTLRGHRLTAPDLEPVLVKLPNLQLLSLSHNRLCQLPLGFCHLKQLCSLNINHNSIDSLEGLSSCTSLQELYAANNSIRDLTPLAGLKNLTTLSVFRNAVTCLEQCMRALHGLPQLHSLDLEGNPVASSPGYRKRAIRELAALRTLDGDLIRPLERQVAPDGPVTETQPCMESGTGQALERSHGAGPQSASHEGAPSEHSHVKMSTGSAALPQGQAGAPAADAAAAPSHKHAKSSALPRPSTTSNSSRPASSASCQVGTAQLPRSASSSSSRCSSGGGHVAQAASEGSKGGERWRPGSSSGDAGSKWGRMTTGAGESLPPPPKGSRPGTPGAGVHLVSDELLNDHPLLLEYLAKHVLAAGFKEMQAAEGEGHGVGRARGSFAKRLRDAASAMAATEGLAPHELASSSAIQAALPPCTPTTSPQMDIVSELVTAASPHELIRQLIKLSEVLIQELNAAKWAASQASSAAGSRPDSSHNLSTALNTSSTSHPGRPDKLTPLSRQPSIGAPKLGDGAAEPLDGHASSSGVHHRSNGGMFDRLPNGGFLGVSASGFGKSMGRAAMSEGAAAKGVAEARTQGDLQAELDELRREVKQLRVENRNVYWLDDECKRLKAELEAVLRKR